jgi:Peptidase C39 family
MSKCSTIRVFRTDGGSVNALDRTAIENYIAERCSVDSDRLGPFYSAHNIIVGTLMTDESIEGFEIDLSSLLEYYIPGIALNMQERLGEHLTFVNAPQDEQTKAYSIVRERKLNENAAATLATIVRYYHMSENLDQVDRLISTRDGAASLLSLKQAAEKLGFSAHCMKGNCEALLKVTLPIIAHEQTQAEQKDKHPGHFVVIFDVDRTSVVVGNTSDGMIQKRPRHQFCQTWTGSLLLLKSKQPR